MRTATMRHSLLFAAALATALCGQEPQEMDYTKIPVDMIEVKVPTVVVPSVEPGKANAVSMKIGPVGSYPMSFYVAPESVKVEGANAVGLQLIDLDGKSLIATINEGRISLMEVATGNAMPGKVELVAVDDGKLDLMDVKTEKAIASDIKASVVEIKDVAVPTVYSAEERMQAWLRFMDMAKTRFKDQRMLQHDIGMTPFNEAMAEWLEIYRTHADYVMDYVPLPDGIRMVAEVRVPRSQEQWTMLRENLAFYASLGYTSALLAIDGGESKNALADTADAIKTCGMKIWFALSGRETLKDTLFISPSSIKERLAIIAPLAEGMLIGWRRTSVHLFDMDLEYANFLIKTARKHNPKLAVLGEGYYGETASFQTESGHLTYNMPRNVSGCEIIGLGYANVNAAMALNALYGSVRNTGRVAVVLGDRPYYATRNMNGLGFLENLAIKQRIERRFTDAGCNGTITLHGDGSDGIYGGNVTDCLSTSPCK